ASQIFQRVTIDTPRLAQAHPRWQPAGRVFVLGRIGEMHVPINGIHEKRLRRLSEEGPDIPVHMLSPVAVRKDMAPVPPLYLLVYPRPHTRGSSDRGGWRCVAVLPQFQVTLEAVRHTKFVRHPAIRTDAKSVIARLLQDFREHRIAVRV